MAEPTSESGVDAGPRPGLRKQPPPLPRWVKAFGIAFIILVLVFIALHLSGVVPMHMHG